MKSFVRVFLKRFRQTHDRESPGWGCTTALLEAQDVCTSPDTKQDFLRLLGSHRTKVSSALEEFQLQLKSSYWSRLNFKKPLKLKFKRKGYRLSLRVSPRNTASKECAEGEERDRENDNFSEEGDVVAMDDTCSPSLPVKNSVVCSGISHVANVVTAGGDGAAVQEAVVMASTSHST